MLFSLSSPVYATHALGVTHQSLPLPPPLEQHSLFLEHSYPLLLLIICFCSFLPKGRLFTWGIFHHLHLSKPCYSSGHILNQWQKQGVIQLCCYCENKHRQPQLFFQYFVYIVTLVFFQDMYNTKFRDKFSMQKCSTRKEETEVSITIFPAIFGSN